MNEREQAAYGEGYDQAHDDVWEALVCSVCGENHDAGESAMCERGEVVSFREWVEGCGRAREQLADFARTGLRVDLNPTRYFGADSSVVDEYQWWCGYISRADAGVRSRARAALGAEEGAA